MPLSMVMYGRQHVLHLGIFLGVQSDQGQILCWFGYFVVRPRFGRCLSVEGENECSLVTLRGLHARRRTHDI